MSETNKGNYIFSDITSIIIKVVVGLASFQLLAPYIWNYLSELVHFRNIWSFRIISGVYFLVPVLVIGLWWKDVSSKFERLANPSITDQKPFDLKERIRKPLWTFTRLSGIIIVFLFVVYFVILFFPYEPCWAFYVIQIVSISGVLILVVSFNRITRINFEFFDDFTPEIKQAENKFKKLRLIFYIFFAVVLALEIAYLTGKDYLKKNSKCVCENTKLQNNSKLVNAFNTIEFKASLTASRKNLESESAKLTLKDNLLKLHHYQYSKGNQGKNIYSYRKLFQSNYDLNISDSLADVYADSSLGMPFRLIQNRIIAFSSFVDSLNAQIENSNSEICLTCSPFELDSIIAIDKLSGNASDSSIIKTKLEWFDLTISILNALEKKADQSAKKQLVAVIGNMQMKGIFLFFNVLIFLSCVYVFLKTNKGILTLLSESSVSQAGSVAGDASDKTKGVSKQSEDEIARINAAIKKQADEDINENQKMLDSVWVYMTIIFGLLIPLLKPVTEEKINIDKPFQMLTIPGQIKNESKVTNEDHSTHTVVDSTRNIIVNISADGKTTITTPPTFELDARTKKLIETIHDKVKSMSTSQDDKEIKKQIINAVQGVVITPGSTAKPIPSKKKNAK